MERVKGEGEGRTGGHSIGLEFTHNKFYGIPYGPFLTSTNFYQNGAYFEFE